MPGLYHWIHKYHSWLLLIIILLGFAKVFYLSQQMDQRSDEDAHVVTGLEYLLYGTYTYERLHPPLARTLAALPIYLVGKHTQPEGAAHECPISFHEHYYTIRNHHHGGGFGSPCLPASKYEEVFAGEEMKPWLKISRISTHLFYVLVCMGVYLLGREMFNLVAGVFAMFLYSVHFTVVDFSAFIMTDTPMAAFMVWALWRWIRWLKKPTKSRMLTFSLLCAGAIMCKYSALYYMPPLMIVLAIAYRFPWRQWRQLFLGGMVVVLTIWAIFGFSLSKPLDVIPMLHNETVREHIPVTLLESQWMPLGEVVQGIIEVKQKNEKGHANQSLHGHPVENPLGSDSYFLMGYLLESPLMALIPVLLYLPFRLLASQSVGAQMSGDRMARVCFGVVLLLQLMLLPSDIHLAMHHAMPLFVFSSLLAGWLWSGWIQRKEWLANVCIIGVIGAYSYFFIEYKPYQPFYTIQDYAFMQTYTLEN